MSSSSLPSYLKKLTLPTQASLTTQKTLPFAARPVIVTPPPHTKPKTGRPSSISTLPFVMNAVGEKRKSSSSSVHICRFCKKVPFPSEGEAKEHEDQCKGLQMKMMSSCHEMLQNINLKDLSDGDSSTNDGIENGDDNINHVISILSRLERLDHIDIVDMEVLNSTKLSFSLKTLKRCKNEKIKLKTKAILSKWGKINKFKRQSSSAAVESVVNMNKSTSIRMNKRHEETKSSNITTVEEKKQEGCIHRRQPPLKKQKRKESTMPVAAIFLKKKESIGTTTSQSSTDVKKGRSKNTKSTSISQVQTKKLASIFCAKPKTSSSVSSTEHQSSTDCYPECILNDKEMLEEHKKAELLLKQQRQRNEKRRSLRKRKQEDWQDKEKAPLAKIFGVKDSDSSHGNSKIKAGIGSKSDSMVSAQSKVTKGKSPRAKSTLSVSTPINDSVEETPAALVDQAKKREEAQMRARLLYFQESAPRFPVPSHVINIDDDKLDSSCPHDKFFKAKLRDEIIYEPKFQQGLDNFSRKNHKQQTAQLSQFEHSDDNYDPLHAAFATVLQPSPREDDGNPTYATNPQLWSAKYAINAIPHDVLGEESKRTADDLMRFINDWKEQREQAIKAAEEAHRKRNGMKKKKKKNSSKKKYHECDDWLESEDEFGLDKVYILCGPTSSGKSSLVYAIAKKCQCYVLEINTSDDRSGASLKRTIEESTQSHSSLGLLKRKSNCFLDENDLIDSDDEDDKKKPSLAVILIDEVDILFESDIGFWQSLSNVAKKARCPIILTAPHPPVQMANSTTVGYRYGYLTKPTPMECASKMCQIAKMENMSWKESKKSEVKEGLALIAKMCNCDLRKLMNEMQLFNHGSTIVEEKYNFKSSKPEGHQLAVCSKEHPRIDSISPKRLLASSYTPMKIRLKDDLEDVYSIDVRIGDQMSLATKLIDPKTILIICPPCIIPHNINEFGLIKKIHERSLDCMYKHIFIQILFRNGENWRSDFPLCSKYAPPIIRYEFPEETFTASEKGIVPQCQPNQTLHEALNIVNKHDNHVNTDLGIEETLQTQNNEKRSCAKGDELEMFLRSAANSSDAALLDDEYNQMYVPHLAGAILECHDSSDIESSHRFSGGSDVYMTRPISHQDRRVQSETCEFSRGLARFDPEISNYFPAIHADIIEFDNANPCRFNSEQTTSISDEDMFLPLSKNVGSQAAAFIRGFSIDTTTPKQNQADYINVTFEKDKIERFDRLLLGANSILSDDHKICNGYLGKTVNCGISLDYLPVLRNMAEAEETAIEVFETLKASSSDDENFTSRSRHRATRSRRAFVRDHYFSELVDDYDKPPEDVCKSLASMKLTLI